MKYFITVFLTITINFVLSQNNLRIFSGQGELFMVTAFDSIQNKVPQTNVLIQSIYEDTLHIKIEFEDKAKFESGVYLFEKGRPTKNKEFNYRINRENGKLKLSYAGYYDIKKLPNPLVPEKPIIDTTSKYKNTRLGHFCELKENKPIYFNNLSKGGKCLTGMPPEYLNYTNLLMVKAQIEEDKFIIAENICRNNCLTVEQLNFILKYIDFEIEKLKIIKIAYFNLSDSENKKNLEKAFRFESSINELTIFFQIAVDPKIQSKTNCKIPSSNEEIKDLENKLNIYSNDSQRLEVFKKLYGEYCYSKDQILVILKLFIHDREKFDAAKMLYYKCVEKENFLAISEIFSYNETISDLKDFVDKQKE
jgi:hypothetical protein